MKVPKPVIKRVLRKYTKIINEIYNDGMTPDDFTFEDIIDKIFDDMR